MSLFSFRNWFLQNLGTNQILEGQFEAENVTKDVANNWAQHTALNRQKAILQFLNGAVNTLSAQITLFATTGFNIPSLSIGPLSFNGPSSVEDDIALLEEWTEIEPTRRQPPILSFWVGDGHLQMDCVIQSLAGINYGRPDALGSIKQVTLTLNLMEYNEFSLDDTGNFETRFHRARARDYYESVALAEYGDPLLGDRIRKRHPTKPNMQTGDVIKFPSIQGIRRERVAQESVQLAGGFGKRATPQKALRQLMFDLRNRPFVSHILVED